MKEIKVYRLTILFLLFVIFLQWVFMAGRSKEKEGLRPLRKQPSAVFKGRIAIVIDDWAYNLNNIEMLDRIHVPLTCSVLPNLNYSQAAIEELHSRNLETILHLPLEPHEKYRLEKDTVMVSMDESEIKNIVERDLDSLKVIKGVSNHMGSLATEDVKTMDVIFSVLKKRNLYFLDSVVTSRSVCQGLAKKWGLRFAKRDVFLDNLEDPVYIKGQISKLKIKARRSGQAIGVGHDRRLTLEVLAEVIPELKKEGYKFVFVSELVK
ncbi:MAG: hypothetical protein AMJ95_13490 [Omnitrophica WOR_2 bacterium SM23_72]|nr:MAG: hypothetical protein AMJ95_13490 [Omnitrophica WOR_2 bacterium SM23_72]